ncbi:MAG TPA: M13 family metallopeptidase [Parafilimonas sp.]|nr:M13 family metallopeptidase [Parafilimonas sp.]
MNRLLSYALLFISLCFTSASFGQQDKNFKFIDQANMDPSVKPGDNFYLYANGGWLKKNPVPASKTRWGSFDVLRQTSLDRSKILCEEAAANPSKSSLYQRVGDLYAAGMDSGAIEKLGYTPIKSELTRLNSLSTSDEVLHEILTLRMHGIGGVLFGFSVEQDDKNVNQYIPALRQGGTTLPDRDYYLKNDTRSQTIRTEYSKYVTDMFKLVGDDDATAQRKAQNILALETALAKAQLSRVELRDPIKTYNKFSLGDLSKTTSGLDWAAMLATMKVPTADSILCNNPTFFKTANSLLSAVPLDTWKAYLQWAIIKNTTAYLSSDFVNRQFQFNQVLTGQKQITPRWQRMSAMVDNNLGELLGQLYVQKYFDESAKQRMLTLVKNVQQTLGERIQRLDWMSDSTKQQAMIKLNAIVNKIAYPDKWETYPGVVINRNDLLGSLKSVDEWDYNDMVSHMGKPVDKTKWDMTPPTINAYYNPGNNEVVFPAGILQFPFFDANADDAIIYGGIAAGIGHELTHGFDDQGRQYAADGNLKDWWTEEDAKKFTERANLVVTQYNGFVVNDTLHVNGNLTLGENLADLGGINVAYEAFKKTDEGKSNKKIDGFTPDQRFFLSWAQIWRSNILPDFQAQLVLTDPHSPGMYRCNGPVQNMDAWYAAFNVQPGDKMYKPESERIKVW